MDTTYSPAPNHHADHDLPGRFVGYLAAITMLFGRRRDARFLCDLALDGSEDHVVDIGCGPGAAVREAARRVPRVSGVDPSEPMLRLARMITTRRRDRIEWWNAGAEQLPFDDDSVSTCWSIASVHHWAALEQGVKEAARVLAPGGRFVAAEKCSRPGATGHASHGWTDDQANAFAGLLEASGFTDVDISKQEVGRRRVVVVSGRAVAGTDPQRAFNSAA